MPSTGKGLNASMQVKPSRFTFFAASSSGSGLPNSPRRPSTGSAMARLLALAREHFLVLADRDRRQETDEQQERRHEQPEHSDVGAPVREAGVIVAEARRKEVFVEAGDEDHVALEPHADDDRSADQEQQHRAPANAAQPKALQRREVADDRAPISPRIGAEE